MSTSIKVALNDIKVLSAKVLSNAGFGEAHAHAITEMLYTCQLDDCQSHGLYRLLMCNQTILAGKIDGHVMPTLENNDSAILRADARGVCPFWLSKEPYPN